MLRWFLTSLILVTLPDHSLLQVLLIQSLSLSTQILLISSRPVPSLALYLFNELLISLYLYLMLPLTQFEFESGLLNRLLLSTLMLGVAVNLGRFVFVTGGQMVQRCRHKKAKIEGVSNGLQVEKEMPQVVD